jgi:hypothetical protein
LRRISPKFRGAWYSATRPLRRPGSPFACAIGTAIIILLVALSCAGSASAQTVVFVSGSTPPSTPVSLPPGTVNTPYNQAVLANDSDGAEDVNGPFDADDVFTLHGNVGCDSAWG